MVQMCIASDESVDDHDDDNDDEDAQIKAHTPPYNSTFIWKTFASR